MSSDEEKDELTSSNEDEGDSSSTSVVACPRCGDDECKDDACGCKYCYGDATECQCKKNMKSDNGCTGCIRRDRETHRVGGDHRNVNQRIINTYEKRERNKDKECKKHISDIAAYKKSIHSSKSELSKLKAKTILVTGENTTLNNEMAILKTTYENETSTHNTKIIEMEARVSVLETIVITHEATILALETKISAMDEETLSMKTKYEDIISSFDTTDSIPSIETGRKRTIVDMESSTVDENDEKRECPSCDNEKNITSLREKNNRKTMTGDIKIYEFTRKICQSCKTNAKRKKSNINDK